MALYTFNDNFQINAPKHIDTRYLNLFSPYIDAAEANSLIPMAYRYLGLTVLVGVIEYWYQLGVTDGDLVPKGSGGGGLVTTADNGLILTGAGTIVELGDVSAPGSPLLRDSYIDAGTSYKLVINANSTTNNALEMVQAGTSGGILVTNTSGLPSSAAIWGNALDNGTGIQGSTTSGVGVYANTTTGGFGCFITATDPTGTACYINGANGAAPLQVFSDLIPSIYSLSAASNNDVQPVLRLNRSSSAGPGTNGIGQSIELLNSDDLGSIVTSTRLISEFPTSTSGIVDSQFRITGVNSSVEVNKLVIGPAATQVIGTRFEQAQGVNVTAANDLVLGTDGNLFAVDGSTQINAIDTTNWLAGSEIGLVFNNTPTLKYNTAGGAGTAPLLLAGGVDYTAAINDYIGFVYDGGVWHETNRKLAAAVGPYTFTNGLTETASVVKLGGTLSAFTQINANGETLLINTTSAVNPALNVAAGGGVSAITASSSSAGAAIFASNSSTGICVWGNTNGSGIGLYGSSSTGIGVSGSIGTGSGVAGYFLKTTTSTNTAETVLRLTLQASGTPADGTGTTLEFCALTNGGATNTISNQLISTWTTAANATRSSTFTITGVNSAVTVNKLTIGPSSTNIVGTRFEKAQGAAVVAANDLTLGVDGNLFSITGNTQINALTTANWQAGSEIGLIFTGTPTVKNNTAGGGGTAVILLSGGVDYVAAADDYLGLSYNGTAWYETARRIAATGGGPIVTASNGLTKVAHDVQLGGTLSANTTINTSTFTTFLTGSPSAATLQVTNTGSAVTSLAADFIVTPSSTNTVVPVLRLQRTSSGSSAIGIGSSIQFYHETSVGSSELNNEIITKLTNVGIGTRTSQMIFTGISAGLSAVLATLDGTGAVKLNKYGVGSFTGTPVYNVLVDASGNLIEGSVPVGSNTTASNGLTKVVNDVQLGGTLTADTTITQGAFKLTVAGAVDPINGATLNVTNSFSAGRAIAVSQSNGIGLISSVSSGTGVWSVATSGTGVYAASGSGMGLQAQTNGSLPVIQAFNVTVGSGINTVLPALSIGHSASVSGATGVGSSIDYTLATTLIGQKSNQLISIWTDATSATRTSEFSITGVNSAVTSTLFALSGNGALKLNKYGVGSFPGTPVYNVLVDASGNFIEGSVPVGSNTTASNGLTKVVNDVQLGGTLVNATTTINAGTNLFVGTSTFTNGALDSAFTFNNTLATGSVTVALKAVSSSTSSSSVAILGVTGTGGAGVYGNGTSTGRGVLGVSSSGIGGEFQSTSGTGIRGFSNNSIAGEMVCFSSVTNTVREILRISRACSGTTANGVGGSIDYYNEADDGFLYLSNSLISKSTVAALATRTSEFSIKGVTAGVTSTQMTVDGGSVTSYGTANGFYCDTAGNGGNFTGSTSGVLASSATIPMWAVNTATSNNTVVDGILVQRTGAYTGAIGVGVKIRFEAKNDAPAQITIGEIVNKLTTVTSGTEVAQFDFKLRDGSGSAINKFSIKGSGVVNIPTALGNYADNAAAIVGGLVTGDIYRNGDILQIVH